MRSQQSDAGSRQCACSVIAGFLLAASAWAQVAGEANAQYKTPEGRAAVGRNLDAPDRDKRQKPNELVEAMELKPGMVVADIGTGVGYMLPFLSRAVGSAGRVVAEDIAQDFLDKAKAKGEKLGNVDFVLGNEKDPRLPERGVDLELALDSYHHYDYPELMLAGLHKGLKPGGRLVIVDYYKRPGAMPNGRVMQHIRIDVDDVIKEVEANHFRLLSKREHIPGSQYMLVFERN